jgi:hypothetical protein
MRRQMQLLKRCSSNFFFFVLSFSCIKRFRRWLQFSLPLDGSYLYLCVCYNCSCSSRRTFDLATAISDDSDSILVAVGSKPWCSRGFWNNSTQDPRPEGVCTGYQHNQLKIVELLRETAGVMEMATNTLDISKEELLQDIHYLWKMCMISCHHHHQPCPPTVLVSTKPVVITNFPFWMFQNGSAW